MTSHPNRTRARLAQYGAVLRTLDGATVVEMVDPNDNARHRYQYRRSSDGGLEKRILQSDGSSMDDGSPWESYTPAEIAQLARMRGRYHPILDPLGL